MKKITFLSLIAFLLTCLNIQAQNAWINEIHYDNEGTDVGECVEVVIENAGSYDLSKLTVTLYNGNGGGSYLSETVNNMTVGDVVNGFSIFVYYPSSIQNGAPDGMALDYDGTLIQFLSYEGSFEATEGVASGLTSIDIGVSESSSSPVGHSLQLSGSGTSYADFVWQEPATATAGSINNGQTFGGTSTNDTDSKADYTGISQPIISSISSLADTEGEAVNIFNFNITDLGTSDMLPTIVTRIVIKPGTANNSPWSTTLAGAKLSTPELGKADIDATVTITDAAITFDLTTPFEVLDGTSEEILFSTWLVSDGSLIEGGILEFGIVGNDHGFLANAEGSQFDGNFMIDSFFDVFTEIEGTGIGFESIPGGIIINEPFPVGVKVVDANGNVDADATGDVTLTTEVGTGLISSGFDLTQTLVGGTYTWPDIIYPGPDDFKIRATYSLNGWDILSDLIVCNEPVFIIINEVDADTPGTDVAEFIELYDGGVGNTNLSGLVVVKFNGSDDQSYDDAVLLDLDGYSTDADGYFVIGNAAVANVDLIVANGFLQNGPDAVALYIGDGTDFPNDTPVTTTNLIDALVYDTNDDDAPGLLVLLNSGEPQINEGGRGSSTTHSNQRIPNGSGGQRNTNTYDQSPPTPGAENIGIYTDWIGAVDADWNTSGNWSNIVPTAVLIVEIPDVSGAKAPFPVISGSAVCLNLNMANNTTLEIGPSGSLTVNGTFTNNGDLTIKSDASGTGSLIESDGVSANVERFISDNSAAGEPAWHYVSVPITSAASDIFEGQYLMYWDEPTETWSFIEELGVALNTNMFGYGVWADPATTLTYIGSLNTGAKSIDLTNTSGQVSTGDNDPSGFNLVGNPYASALDWDVNDGSGWTRTNIGLSIYLWNGVQYGTYTKGSGGSGINGATNIIPPHQGYMVFAADGGGTLAVDNGARVHSSTGFFKGSDEITSTLKFKVFGNSYSDEFIINVNENASNVFDLNYDALKFFGIEEAPQAYTITSASEKLSINSIPSVKGSEIIPVGIDVGEAGFYEFSLIDMFEFNNPILLEDLEENKIIDLKSSNYKFYATPDDEASRFQLRLTHNDIFVSNFQDALNGVVVFTKDQEVVINSVDEITGDVKIFDIMGRESARGYLENDINKVINMNAEKGTYIINIVTDLGVVNKKVFIK